MNDREPTIDGLDFRWFGLAASPYSGEGWYIVGDGGGVLGKQTRGKMREKEVVVSSLDQTVRIVEQLHKVVVGHIPKE
jgi:hypothetical protein